MEIGRIISNLLTIVDDYTVDIHSAGYLQHMPELVIYPGLAISLAVLGFNLLGDGLRDALDPYLKV